MDSDCLTFDADGKVEDISSWRYKLTLNPDHIFILDFHLEKRQKEKNWV